MWRIVLLAAMVSAGVYVCHLAWERHSRPHGIVIHHTASAGRIGGELVGAVMIDKWHKRRGFWREYEGRIYHIGYHYVIRTDGVVEEGRPVGCRGAHATHGNDCIGICVVGNFTRAARGKTSPTRPTRAQMSSLHQLIGELVEQYHFTPEQIHTHREVDGDTACPGDRFPIEQVRKWVKEMNREGSVIHLTAGTSKGAKIQF